MLDNNTNSLESISIDVASALAPVKLQDSMAKDFEDILFPIRAKNSRGVYAASYGELATPIVELSSNINHLKRVLGYIVVRGGELEDLEPSEFEAIILERVTSLRTAFPLPMMEETGKVLITAMHSGQYHTIKDSTRFSGGKDILFSGIPRGGESATSSGATIRLTAYEPTVPAKDSETYKQRKLEHYEAELAKKALSALDEINNFLFKKSLSLTNITEWVQIQLSMDTDFSKLDSIFEKYFGFNLNLFTKPFVVNPEFKKYMSLLVMVAPPREVIHEMGRHYNALSYKEKNPDSDIDTSEPKAEDLYTQEAATVNRDYSVSIALNFPKEFVDYISQNTNGDSNLYCLNSWVTQWSRAYLRPKGARVKDRVKYSRLPRYIIPSSKNSSLIQHRKDEGVPVDEGRVNEDRISVSPRGTLSFMPKTNDKNFSNAEEYEQVVEKALAASYSVGAPLTESSTMLSRVFAISHKDPKIEDNVSALKKQLDKFKGTLLSLNWDYNVSLVAGSSNSFAQYASDLNGSTIPSALALGDYLGYDFAQEGERDQKKTFVESMNYLIPGNDFSVTSGDTSEGSKSEWELSLANSGGAGFIFNISFQKLLKTYAFLLRKEKVKGLQDLVSEAMSELNVTNLNTSPLDTALYKNLDDEGKIKGDYLGNEPRFITELLLAVLQDANGNTRSNLYKIVSDEVGLASASLEVREHSSYFLANTSTMADFGNIYTYVGGLVFKKVCEEITKADAESLLKPLDSHDETIGRYSIPFEDVSKVVMPLAFMYSKYVPNAETILEQAEQEAESFKEDTSIGVDDIKAPGIAQGSQVFPHQIKAHRSLRARPKFAVLDVAPGGGKTITLLLDIMALVQEMQAEGGIKPLIISPDKLIANWCNDLIKITKGQWNAVPIHGSVIESWGEERLGELINSAPPNTIFFTGINFLKSKAQSISFGPKRLKVFGGVEFIKRFGFNYIALDESHKIKAFNPKAGKISIVHSAAKQVFTQPSVKFARLATGTLIHGMLSDVVGQAAMFGAHIFRTPDDFAIDAQAEDGAIRVRSKFGEQASVITIKRKEWAFMLPSPIDSFIEVDLLEKGTREEEILSQVYNALLQQTIEELNTAIKAKSQSSDDDDDSGEDDPDFDEDDELSEVNPALFRNNMQRLEQLITDPWGDEAFEDAALKAGLDPEFVSPKVREVVARLDNHFNTYKYDSSVSHSRIVKWELGMEARELDVVEHMGIHYMRRRLDDGSTTPRRRVTPPSKISPDQDPENWKVEQRGKVIIFTRYIRSVDAIYKALPPKYKSTAVRFHSQVDGGWENIEAFKKDPEVQIIIANEMAISEGHNLQMASRIIRVETPWSPGEYEQSTARIFRPDVAAATIENGKPGDMAREVIYIDWLMCKGTMEVAKVARLMWKSIEKTKFDEKGNPLYDDIMETTLPKISMDVNTLIQASTDGFDSFIDHFRAKATLNAIESSEFHEMRKTTISSMKDLPIEAPLDSFKVLDSVPLMANQNVPDTQGFGLIPFLDWWGQYSSKNYDNNHETLNALTKQDILGVFKGLPVKTEFGTGVIVGLNIKMVKKADGKRHIDYTVPATSVKVRFNANDEMASIHPRRLFVASKVTQEDIDSFFSTNKPWSTNSERKAIEKAEREQTKREEAAERIEERRKKRVSKRVETEGKVKEKARRRRRNIDAGKPINEGITRVSGKLPPLEEGTFQVDKDGYDVPDMNVNMHVSVFNGFLALHVNATDPDSKELRKLGFKAFGEYAYAEFKTYPLFEKALDFIDARFSVDAATIRRLSAANDAFDDHKRMGFNMRLASKVQKDLPMFFRARHRASQDKKTIKIYPVIMDDRVRLVIDLTTSPRARRYLNKQIDGGGRGGKWKLHEGMSIFFALNKTNAKAKIKELLKEGYQINNLDEVLKDIAAVKLVRSKQHNDELRQMAK